jgi:hypothetical protein
VTTEDNVKTTQIETIALAEAAAARENVEIVALVSSADALTIETSEQLDASGGLLTTIKARQKALSNLRLSITRPMDQAKKRVMEVFQPTVGRLASAERTIKDAVLTYTQEQERQRRVAQAKLDAAAAAEREHLQKQADQHRATGRDGRAETLEQRAETVEAPTVAQPEVPSGAVHLRTTWHAEVTDLAALAKACAEGQAPLELIQPNMAVLNAQARTFKGALALPGVQAVSEEGVTARAG